MFFLIYTLHQMEAKLVNARVVAPTLSSSEKLLLAIFFLLQAPNQDKQQD